MEYSDYAPPRAPLLDPPLLRLILMNVDWNSLGGGVLVLPPTSAPCSYRLDRPLSKYKYKYLSIKFSIKKCKSWVKSVNSQVRFPQ